MKNRKEGVFPSRQLGLGTWLSSGSPVVAELASEFRFDWLLFDLEHGCMPESSLFENLQAIRKKDIHLIVRIPDINPALIGRVLDWGATGIMLPHVDDPAQALTCIDAMRYPPSGHRGYSSSARAYAYGLNKPEDLQKVPFPLFIAQIENDEGVKNAAAIAGIEGVDVLFVGPSDLKLNLSTRPDKQSGDYHEALKKVIQAAETHEKQAGILISDMGETESMYRLGFSCLAIASDIGILREGYKSIVLKYDHLF